MTLDIKTPSVIISGSILLVLAICSTIQAQDLPVRQLAEVEISEKRISEYSIGAATTQIDSVILSHSHTSSLADIIANYTSSQIKSYGNGMLASISFRGTGPEHTAVLWHGINIAYPMLGQSDFSLLPMALNSDVIIQQGTGSSLYGSGALGGTISLSNHKPSKGFNISLAQWAGSFGTLSNQGKVSIRTKKYFVEIKSFWERSTNDFTFKNITQIGSPTEKQQNAGYHLFGFGVESGVDVGKRGMLKLSGQLLMADRNLQPSMNSGNVVNNQTDTNQRFRLAYEHNGDLTNWLIQYVHLNDVIGYNGENTSASQDNVRTELNRLLIKNIKLKLAADYTFIAVNSPFYITDRTTESRGNLWASVLLTPKPWAILSINLRQALNSIYDAPFSPSIGGEFTLLAQKYSSLRLSTLLAKGFRLPTLNELYWEPGGNTGLQPEDSYSAEIGLSGTHIRKSSLEYGARVYRMWVDNWILWRPTGPYWSPENIKKVDVYGIELNGSLSHQVGTAQLKWIGNYAFTRSINRSGLDQFDRSIDKQLSYVPIHKGSLSLVGTQNSWSLTLNSSYTGKRFTTADNENYLPAFVLLNLGLARSFQLNAFNFSAHAAINNITNTSYQSVVNKAMPGINFLLGLTINFYKR